MKVKIKQILAGSKIPSYAKEGDAGMDLTAVSREVVNEGQFGYIEYDIGIGMEIPEDYVGLIFPRSSISKTGLILANSVGVVDSSYRGSIKVRFKAIPDTLIYEVGERVAQIVIMPYPHIEFDVVEELSTTERGEGGFGHTNK